MLIFEKTNNETIILKSKINLEYVYSQKCSMNIFFYLNIRKYNMIQIVLF